MNNIDAINEAAEKYANNRYEELYKSAKMKEFSDTTRISDFTDGIDEGFKQGALSDAAKQYWYEIFKAEQNQSAGVLQPSDIEACLNITDKKIFDEFGWTGEYHVSAKDILDLLIDQTPQKQLSDEVKKER